MGDVTVKHALCIALALLTLCPLALAQDSLTLGPFVVTQPEDWTLTYEQHGVDASMYLDGMDAYVYFRRTDVSGDVSMLPLLHAMGSENAARFFASAMFSARPDALSPCQIAALPGARGSGRVNGVDAAFAAVEYGDCLLSVAASSVKKDMTHDDALDLALSRVSLSPTSEKAHTEAKSIGPFFVPCPPHAAWRSLPDGLSLIRSNGLVTVSLQWERQEGQDTAEMAEALGDEAFLDTASSFFGGDRVVTDISRTDAPEGAYYVSASIDAAALYENMIKRSAADLTADFGADVTTFTAHGALLLSGEYQLTLIAISADPALPAGSMLDQFVTQIALP